MLFPNWRAAHATLSGEKASECQIMNLPPAEPAARNPTEGASVSKAWLRALEMTARLDAHPERTLPALIDDLADKFGDARALLSERECLTYKALAERSNKYARWALDLGLGRGDVVGLLMPNRPEYLAIWLGITRVGAIVALLNSNISGKSLAHCLAVAEPKHVIVAAELLAAYSSAADELSALPKLWVHGEAALMQRFDCDIDSYPGTPLDAQECRPVTLSDRALYVYTSGTTGLPKAANVSHHRLMSWSHWFAGMMNVGCGDRIYDCLPMYHSIGGIVAPTALLVAGGSVVVSEGFSASRFWNEIVRWDCTILQYIGELCRYLVNTPASDAEWRHRLRLASGNGLRADVWTRFQSRFRIPKILEFYAGTEHNFSLFNVEGRPGSVGRVPNFLRHRFPATLIKLDQETGEPIRDAQGLCLRCAPGETGEAIGKVATDGSNLASRFEGYTNAADSDRKLIRNIFREGDVWLRTGDLMRMDDRGDFYFVDRLGDTFRWKGENVSASEVSDTIHRCHGVLDACVYGVTVAENEGRAGMAALVVEPSFTLAALHRHLVDQLPDYAHPRFIRIVGKLAATETFKTKRQELMREAYDPSTVADELYVRDAGHKAFIPLDSILFATIEAGRFRL
jgi:fatty-acyl-CoA synthase